MNAGGGGGHSSRVRVAGPLAPYADGFREDLVSRGYAGQSVFEQVRLMAHLSAWLNSRGVPAGGLTAEVAEEYLRVRLDQGHRAHVTGRGLAPLLGYLRGLGAVPEPVRPAPRTPAEVLLAEFGDYLARERGLAPASVGSYLRYAGAFLAELPPPPAAALAELSAGQVTAFVVRQADLRGRGSAAAAVTALRCLLRFLHAAGHVPAPLAAAVPSVPAWATALPRPVGAGEVAAVLAVCDRDGAAGRRDYAIILLLVRLGLRAGEVKALTLDDVDWRAGELTVRGKGGRADVLPLPADVGEALADYVQRGRPRCATRTLFVTLHAPFTALTGHGPVFSVLRRACRRAGVTPFGPHRLRHALACELLRKGAPLAEVGQLLRHNDERTTAVYAKADHDALATLARPCPQGGAL